MACVAYYQAAFRVAFLISCSYEEKQSVAFDVLYSLKLSFYCMPRCGRPANIHLDHSSLSLYTPLTSLLRRFL